MNKFAIATLGCKVNQYESAGIVEALTEKGFSHVPFTGEADIYIVNTCTVTGKTDYQSRQLIRRAHRANPAAQIIVTGCYAQIAPHELAALPGVAMVVGTEAKERIPAIITRGTGRQTNIAVSEIARKGTFSGLFPATFPGHTRAYLKIQDGCNSFCSYCIIPYARGRSRSLPEDEVLRQVRNLSQAGYREVILTGIHLGMYGNDLSPRSSLITILRKIEEDRPVERLRLSSIEPMEVTDDIIAHLTQSDILCRHLHIPLQSGDNSILQSMKRVYDKNLFQERIDKIVAAIPDIAIGIDVMVGFPGEGDAEFELTRALIEGMPVAYCHVFPYSPRPGTEASHLADQVSDSDKKARGRILREIGYRKRTAFNRTAIGTTLPVLVEDARDRTTGHMKGFSDNYIPFLIPGVDESAANDILSITAESETGGKIIGRQADAPQRQD